MMSFEHCCNEMSKHLSEGEVAVIYNDVKRSYGLAVLSEAYRLPLNKGCCTRQKIYYCPWCKTKLPNSLEDELIDILFDELNLDDGLDDPKLPEEFKSGEWWRRRNL